MSMQIVKEGSTGNGVYMLQAILRAACYVGADGKPIAVDGRAGKNTIYALKECQKHLIAYGADCGCGKIPDGICGPKMWRCLGVE